MSARLATYLLALSILLTAGISFVLYPILPDRLPVHWDWLGRPDGWADKGVAAFLIPNLTAALLLLMHLLPRFSPKRLSIEAFAETYYYVFALIGGLMMHLHAMTLLGGLMPDRDWSRCLLTGLFLFFGLLGNLLGKVRRNLWVGIRTPWSLASDSIWNATHRLAARLMTGLCFLAILLLWLGASPAVGLVLLGVAVIAPVVYSYLLFRRERG
ncbi:MAG: SdpI family protein [Capsulimonadales bacterium]|nr:SdpI family protein [Capsulimonadales bacterium]